MREDLKELRRMIDDCDRKILSDLEERIAISRKIGVLKRADGTDFYDPARETQKFEELKELAGSESRPYVEELYKTIFDISKKHQNKPAFGVLGRSLPHTYSPQIHNLMCEDYSYSVIEREPDELDALFSSGVFGGFNVTIPYKREAFARCDETDEAARVTGSVNTVVFKDGKTLGYNTDYYGFMFMMKRAGIDPSGKKVLVLGTGGAASAVEYALKTSGASEIFFCDLETPINYSNVYDECGDVNVIVNCTPVGMFPKVDADLLDLERFGSLEACLDVIYNPSRTLFLQKASARGLKTAGGLAMLVAQAYKAMKFFRGEKEVSDVITDEDAALINKVITTLESEMMNITFIGMPGCGKSVLGQEIARITGRRHVDLDDAYTEEFGVTPAHTIETEGEDAFRANESEVAAKYLAQSGLVISCGGGIVTREVNYFPLRCNSHVFYIERPLEGLASDGRPLSASQGVKVLFEQRRDKYEMLCDHKLSYGRFDDQQEFLDQASREVLKYISGEEAK
ncbi:MAG: chorismate mutase [Clostridiales bacterium]|nr:chorismate mutase [Clostridiales bacterium]